MFPTQGSVVKLQTTKGQRTCQYLTNAVLQLESPFLLSCYYTNLMLVSLDLVLLTNLEDRLLSVSPFHSGANRRPVSVGTVAEVLKGF